VGGVIGAGETVMEIVPTADTLIVKAKVAPRDIDQVHGQQKAVIRFSAFNQRTTPELHGMVEQVSADLATDAQKQQSFYVARITLSDEEKRKLGDLQLVPGMPAEVFIQTGERTALSYLVKPIRDQIARAFKED
jgi:HlyD family secretion protein